MYKAHWKSLRCSVRLEELRDRDALGTTPCHCTDTTQQLTNRLSLAVYAFHERVFSIINSIQASKVVERQGENISCVEIINEDS